MNNLFTSPPGLGVYLINAIEQDHLRPLPAKQKIPIYNRNSNMDDLKYSFLKAITNSFRSPGNISKMGSYPSFSKIGSYDRHHTKGVKIVIAIVT